MIGLRWSLRREPLTWFRAPTGTVRVVCSQGHSSFLQHLVMADGTLVPPGLQLPSLHCGTCNEEMPLQLAGWPGPSISAAG